MTIKEIWFEGEYLYGRDGDGKLRRQSLLWYPKLLNATNEERAHYNMSTIGIHWRGLAEDVSFESFEHEESIQTSF